MNKYNIKAADRETGDEFESTIQAASLDDAYKVARSNGWAVSKVIPVSTDTTPTSPPTGAGQSSSRWLTALIILLFSALAGGAGWLAASLWSDRNAEGVDNFSTAATGTTRISSESTAASVSEETTHQTRHQKAEMLYRHGLVGDAKRVLIEVLAERRSSPSAKADAYYLLGVIALEQGQINLALETWRSLLDEHPQSTPAAVVRDRIRQLAEVASESTRESIDNIVALSYLRHGDFWSRDKSSIFVIDSSWLDTVDAAITWYDNVIDEFPGTVAARIAYEEKMRTLLGWEKRGVRDTTRYGVKGDFAKYMPMLLSTFSEYEASFPDSASMQAFRYQIAQAYWSTRNFEDARNWLKKIIDASGPSDSFYKDVARRRLERLIF